MTATKTTMRGVLRKCLKDDRFSDIRSVELTTTLEDGVFRVAGGPTGYESAHVKDMLRDWERLKTNGWHACAGTVGSWDNLHFSGEEIVKAFKALGIAPEEEQS